MAVTQQETESRLALLRSLCDTLLPALETDEPGERGLLLARPGTALGLDRVVATLVASQPEPARHETEAALDRLEGAGFAVASLDQREAALRGDVDPALQQLAGTVLALFYAASDEDGRNPNWPGLDYPGPVCAPPSPEQAPKTIAVESVELDRATLRADACVVGSGAGGSVIASALQAAGLSSLCSSAAAYRNEADFRQLEDIGARDLFLRGGMFFSSDAPSVFSPARRSAAARSSTRWCASSRRRTSGQLWAADGLEGLDSAEFDGHLASVSRRIGVNTGLTRQNRTSALLAAGIERFGLTWQTIARNAGQGDDPRYCGYCHNGCQHGCKQSTLKTYLQDAADEGARFVVECDVRRLLTRDGHAAGVEATVTRADGTRAQLTVEADTVVVAAGGLESPALLLRSGLGGPAVGHHLRVHPTYFVGGIYDEPVRGWEGQVQSVVSLDRTRAVDGDGYLVECTTLSPGMWAVISPWLGGEDHKRRMLELPHTAPWHAVCHDHGSRSRSASTRTANRSSTGRSSTPSIVGLPPSAMSSSPRCTGSPARGRS